jgi:hypothetical protein
MADFGIGEGLFALLDAIEGAGAVEGVTVSAPAIASGISGGTAAGIAGGAAAGAGAAAASGAFGGSAASPGGTVAATGGAPSATSANASAAPGGTSPAPAATSSPGFFGNLLKYAGPAVAGGVASTGAQALFGNRRGVSIPPPPGAAMIDPAGAQAAAMIRARQAIAGGLQSTVSPGANSQPAFTGATSGGKTLLGQ